MTNFNKPFNRREMLKVSSVIGAGALFLTNGILAKGASPNEKLAVAFIGLGNQGKHQLGGIAGAKDVETVALCDVDDKVAGKTYENFPKAQKFYDFREMFDKLERSLDAVSVSTPDHTHFHPVIRSIRAGKHVYCEKPLAHSPAEIRIITEEAAKYKVATQLGCQRHTIPNFARVVELVQSGAIGEITEVHSWMGGDRGMPPEIKEYPAVPDTIKWELWLGPALKDWKYSPELAPYKWRFWWDFGTGETGNWACHILDIPYWALNLKYPQHVSADGPQVDAERTPKQMAVVYDFAIVQPVTKKPAVIKLYWSHSSKPACLEKYGITSEMNKRAGGTNNLFVGSKGMILTGFNKHILLPEETYKDFERPEQTIPKSPGFHREWIDACKGGKAASCNFAYSGPMAETAILGNTAFRAGHKSFRWDAEKMIAADCPEVQSALKPEFRKGWKY